VGLELGDQRLSVQKASILNGKVRILQGKIRTTSSNQKFVRADGIN